jgi:signal transduction histidine kinase
LFITEVTLPVSIGAFEMKPNNPLRLTFIYSLPFILIITVLFLSLRIWERNNIAREQKVELRETASALVEQIILTRIWNADHGGVYAAIDERTKPNPFLDDPERDIVSLAGKRYTKINPAYMTRQIAELLQERHGYRFHLTSLKPLNPANYPDPWEADALKAFELGSGEQMTIAVTGNERSFRLIAPLVTEQPCLQCHAKQHYSTGDVRGGISVTIPMKESDLIHSTRARAYLLAGLGLWLIIVTFIVLASWLLSRKVTRSIDREIELNQLKAIIELAGAAAHEIRQPLTVLSLQGQIIKAKIEAGEPLTRELDIVIKQCERINGTITKMQNITEYRTKPYLGNTRIVDLDVEPDKFKP